MSSAPAAMLTRVPRRSLFRNEIGPKGASALGEALKTNSALTALKCVPAQLWPPPVSVPPPIASTGLLPCQAERGEHGRKVVCRWQVARGVAGMHTRKHKSQATSRQRSSIAPLMFNAHSHSVGFNRISPEGATALGEALTVNRTLTTLTCVPQVGIGDWDVHATNAAAGVVFAPLRLWRECETLLLCYHVAVPPLC